MRKEDKSYMKQYLPVLCTHFDISIRNINSSSLQKIIIIIIIIATITEHSICQVLRLMPGASLVAQG